MWAGWKNRLIARNSKQHTIDTFVAGAVKGKFVLCVGTENRKQETQYRHRTQTHRHEGQMVGRISV